MLHGGSPEVIQRIDAAGPGLPDWIAATGSVAGALALAFLALGHGPLRRFAGARGRLVLTRLRELHSSQIGDYVTWLVVGATLLGGVFAVTLG